MDICDIVIYMALGILGIALGFISMVILSFGFVWLSEKRLESEIEQDVESDA